MVVLMASGAAVLADAPAGKTNTVGAATAFPCEPGQTSDEIKAVAKPEWSYFVYLPKDYTPTRKWPVMFIMSPGGGGAGALGRYVEGAEMNNWILACSVQSRNNFDRSGDAIMAMVDDVARRLPIDPKRMYSSGFSGGSRQAFGLAKVMKNKGFAGVLACGAGGHPEVMSPKTVVFGLCGSNCFNRWDMACTLKGTKNQQSRLRFFPGNHDWAEAPLIKYGTTWLNACHMNTAQKTSESIVEQNRLIEKIRAEILREKDTDPEKAYDWVLCLSVMSPSQTANANAMQEALLKNPKVAKYAAGLKEMDLFIKKHFATSVMDYLNNNGTPAAKKDAEQLAKKYADTSLATLFTRMGEPSVKP